MNWSTQVTSGLIQQASGGWLERAYAGYHSTGTVAEVEDYEEMVDDQ